MAKLKISKELNDILDLASDRLKRPKRKLVEAILWKWIKVNEVDR